MTSAQYLAEELLGGFGVSRWTQQEVQGLAFGINNAVEVMPHFFDLDVRLVNAI